MVLVSCGGGSGGGDSSSNDVIDPVSEVVVEDVVDINTLSSFFVENFNQFETKAKTLIERQSKYTFQDISWYEDINGNGRYDANTDKNHDSFPLLNSAVHYAHAAGLTGKNVTISIVDNGFLVNHEVFDGKTIHKASGLDVANHGTTVAAIAAGESERMIGMAPEADLVLGSYATFGSLKAATDMTIEKSAVAQNNSWGFVNAHANQSDLNSVFASSPAKGYLNSLVQYSQNGVVVFAVSNNKAQSQAGLMAGMPILKPEVKDGWVAVVNAVPIYDAANDDVVAASLVSSACLDNAEWCIAADGQWRSAKSSGDQAYGFSSGSSLAAPMVTGTMALLAQAFPDLTPHELRMRILASADRDFAGFETWKVVSLAEGVDVPVSYTYGHGFLDVKAALLPIGVPTTLIGSGVEYDTTQPIVVGGVSSGDAIEQSLVGIQIVARDNMGGAFVYDADELVATQSAISLGQELSDDWQNGNVDCCSVSAFFGQSVPIHFIRSDLELSVHVPTANQDTIGYGISIGRAFNDEYGNSMRLEFALGQGQGELFPQWFESDQNNQIASMEFAYSTRLSNTTMFDLSGVFGVGQTSTQLAQEESTILFTAMNAGLNFENLTDKNDNLRLSYEMPFAITKGSTSINLPTGFDQNGVSYSNIDIDLAPQSREMRFALEYTNQFSNQSELYLRAVHAKNHGHIKGASDSAVFVGLRSSF